MVTSGQYLAVDPKGRAVMIAAIEKQKLVYIMNRDDQARLTISSPLEAHKANTIVFDCCGVDVGFENPTFACLGEYYILLLVVPRLNSYIICIISENPAN